MSSWKERSLTLVDTLICLLVIFPLSVLHWRGTWQLQDEYFLPDNLLSSSWISLTIGANVCILELLMQPLLQELLAIIDNHVVYILVSRLHLYVHGWAVMCYWRGIWNLLDLYLTPSWINSTVIFGICQLLMLVSQTVRTPVGVPLAVQLDTDPDLLEPDIVFKTPHNKLIPFVLDCLFTQFIVVSSSICIWRGIWNIIDAFIFPHVKGHSDTRSDMLSLGTGLSITILFFSLQVPTSWISAKLDRNHWIKVIFEDCIFLVLIWSNLLLWRGSWNLCIHHFLPIHHVGSWVSHWIGTVGLMIFQVFNNVGLHGIVRDGSYVNGEGIYVTYYLRILLKDKTPSTTEGKQNYAVVEQIHSETGTMLSSGGESGDDELSSLEELHKLLVHNSSSDNKAAILKDNFSIDLQNSDQLKTSLSVSGDD